MSRKWFWRGFKNEHFFAFILGSVLGPFWGPKTYTKMVPFLKTRLCCFLLKMGTQKWAQNQHTINKNHFLGGLKIFKKMLVFKRFGTPKNPQSRSKAAPGGFRNRVRFWIKF